MLRAVSAKTGISVSMQTSLCVTARHEQVPPAHQGGGVHPSPTWEHARNQRPRRRM